MNIPFASTTDSFAAMARVLTDPDPHREVAEVAEADRAAAHACSVRRHLDHLPAAGAQGVDSASVGASRAARTAG